MNWNVYKPVQKAYGYIAWHIKNTLCRYEEGSDLEMQKQLPVMRIGISDHKFLRSGLFDWLFGWLIFETGSLLSQTIFKLSM